MRYVVFQYKGYVNDSLSYSTARYYTSVDTDWPCGSWVVTLITHHPEDIDVDALKISVCETPPEELPAPGVVGPNDHGHKVSEVNDLIETARQVVRFLDQPALVLDYLDDPRRLRGSLVPIRSGEIPGLIRDWLEDVETG